MILPSWKLLNLHFNLSNFKQKYIYLVTGTANDGGEDSPGGVITGETGLAHAGAIVNNQSGGIFVTHVGWSGSTIGVMGMGMRSPYLKM